MDGSYPSGSTTAARENAIARGRFWNTPEVHGPIVAVPSTTPTAASIQPQPRIMGKCQSSHLSDQLAMRPTRSSPPYLNEIKLEPPCSVELESLQGVLPTLRGPFKFKKPLRLMELDLTGPQSGIRGPSFGALHSLQVFVEGMDKFQNPDGREKVAVPYDEINKVPETTFRQLERFRWWGVPNYGPDCPPLPTETRKRNGRKHP